MELLAFWSQAVEFTFRLLFEVLYTVEFYGFLSGLCYKGLYRDSTGDRSIRSGLTLAW